MSTYYLGQYDTSTNYKFVGQIADVALYPSASTHRKSPQTMRPPVLQRRPPMPSPITPPDDPAVVSYESVIQGEGASQFAELDETLGTTATIDFTSSIGTYIGADVLNAAPGPIVGSTANAVSIPGGTAQIGVAMPSANWVAGNSFTIETWVKPTLHEQLHHDLGCG